ncbi:phosphodiester glycosidase family protein [Niallia oryzisoli]|uniref:phosphodiester glycosidase family protein n=1 Tax=Niallia oryzisoli TaxID=1737571 RepID=UPI0037354B57
MAVVTLIVLLGILLVAGYSKQKNPTTIFDRKTYESKTTVAPGVTHTMEKYQSGFLHEAIHILEIQLDIPNTKLELAIPNPLHSLKTTTSFAKENSTFGHRVIGAVNAAYYFENGYPANLIAKDNQILHYGIIGERVESPTQRPVAFGLSKDGKALIDYFYTELSFAINGSHYPIDRINSDGTENKTVLYTPTLETTGAYGQYLEIIVKNSSQNTDRLHFGDSFTGRISEIKEHSQTGSTIIPDDGFVLSIHKKELAAQLGTLPADTAIEIHVSIDEKWQDTQYMLAAGPLLVKEGKEEISMPMNTSFVKTRQPRTAAAIDSTGKRVMLVTVDGRQRGYSNGVSLHELAAYLISKGAVAAINLDGGGSTTFTVQNPSTEQLELVNRPSEGRERKVSAILQAVTTSNKKTK